MLTEKSLVKIIRDDLKNLWKHPGNQKTWQKWRKQQECRQMGEKEDKNTSVWKDFIVYEKCHHSKRTKVHPTGNCKIWKVPGEGDYGNRTVNIQRNLTCTDQLSLSLWILKK